MAETFTAAKFWAKLDELGEEQVRLNIIGQIYGPNSDKLRLANEWLRRKAQEREDAAARELLEAELAHLDEAAKANLLAREANDIAHSSMVFARTANTIASEANALAARSKRQARMANVIAALAAIASIAAVVVSIFRGS